MKLAGDPDSQRRVSVWLAVRPAGYHIPRGRILAIYGGLMLVVFLAALEQTVVATAGPSMAADLGGGSLYPWVFTAYLLTSALSVPVWGKAGDTFGKRRPLLVAIATFAMGSLLCGVGRSMPQVVAFRALQGIGGGALMPLAQATIASIVPLRERGKYQGLIVAAFTSGTIAGPFLGGIAADTVGWRWAFYGTVPLAAAAFGAVAATMGKPALVDRRIDVMGAVCLAAAAAPILVILSLRENGASASWVATVVALAGAAAASGCLVVVERRAVEPILPFFLVRRPMVAGSLFCIASSGAVQLVCVAYVPLFLQAAGSSATSSGIVLIPMLASGAGTALITGQVILRTGRMRPMAVAGPFLTASGLLILSGLDSETAVSTVALASALVGGGLGLMNQVFLLAVQNAVGRSLVSSATALTIFARTMGGALGVAVVAAIVTHELQDGLRLRTTAADGNRLAGVSGAGLGHALHLGFLVTGLLELAVVGVVLKFVRDINLRTSVEDASEPSP